MTDWVVVVPVKGSTASKTRLADFPLSPNERRRLALAFAQDTVAAIGAVPDVRQVIVVTSDSVAATELGRLGAEVVADPADGLNAAIADGLRYARRSYPEAALAVMTADLPTLTTGDVVDMLELASGHPGAFVADAGGSGTTTITALAGVRLEPLFGLDSATRHEQSGLARLDVPPTSSVRHDVDTPSDLEDALRRGVGVHTARALAGSA